MKIEPTYIIVCLVSWWLHGCCRWLTDFTPSEQYETRIYGYTDGVDTEVYTTVMCSYVHRAVLGKLILAGFTCVRACVRARRVLSWQLMLTPVAAHSFTLVTVNQTRPCCVCGVCWSHGGSQTSLCCVNATWQRFEILLHFITADLKLIQFLPPAWAEVRWTGPGWGGGGCSRKRDRWLL